jgi:hypothetical protein
MTKVNFVRESGKLSSDVRPLTRYYEPDSSSVCKLGNWFEDNCLVNKNIGFMTKNVNYTTSYQKQNEIVCVILFTHLLFR